MTPCSVQLFRFDNDEENTDSYATDEIEEEDVADQESEAPVQLSVDEVLEKIQETADIVEDLQIPETLALIDELSVVPDEQVLDQQQQQSATVQAEQVEPLMERMEAETDQPEDEMPQPFKELPAKRRPAPVSHPVVHSKRQKTVAQTTKKVKQKKPPPAVCCLCGAKFQSGIALAQHQKTHMPRTNTPVFPCGICGKKVKNLKMHLRQHKNDESNEIGVVANGVKASKSTAIVKSSVSSKSVKAAKSFPIKLASVANGVTQTETQTIKLVIVKNGTKVEEASSSTDAVFSMSSIDPENGITSNEALTNSDDIILPSLPNGTQSADMLLGIMPSSNDILPPSPSSVDPASVGPAIEFEEIYEEFPSTFEPAIKPESCGENEPSQSTQPVMETLELTEQNPVESAHNVIDDIQINLEPTPVAQQFPCTKCARHFKTADRLAKHLDLHNKKVQCDICGRVVALSYKRMHDKRYHDPESNIPSNPDQSL